jgi:hypothetical protein
LLHFLVRLACVRHAASVDSEPGSNSRLKPDVSPIPGRRSGRRDKPHRARKLCEALHCENDQTKTSSFSHDWHVQPDCQRSVAGFRLSGPLWIKEYTAELCVLELVALLSCGMLTDSRNLRAFTETTEISGACQWEFLPSTLARLQHQI